MSDIVERLRAWVYTDSLYAVAVEAADEIERLRAELSRLRLTDAEREAVEVCAHAAENCNGFNGDPTRPAIYDGRQVAAALRGLLERMG